MRLIRAVGKLLLLVGLLAVLAAGALGWLYATPPQPRAVEGWQLGPPLPARRGELAMAVGDAEPCPAPPCPAAERLYVLGGLAGLFRPLTRVAIYNPNRKSWQPGPPLPEPRHHLAAAGLAGSIYVSGGTDVAGLGLGHRWPPKDNFWRLAAGSAQWENVGPMIEPRWGHRMVAHDGRLYVIGGRGPSGRVLIYTPGKGWSTGVDMPRPRDHLSVVAVDGRIWAIGGRDPRSLARVDIYDPSTDSWQPGPDLPAPTSGAAEGAMDGVIFVYGGEEPSFADGAVNDRHWMVDTRSQRRRWEPAPAPPLAVHGTSGAVLQDKLVIAGGATWHGALSIVGWTDALQILTRPAIARR